MRLYEFNNKTFAGKSIVGVGNHLLTVQIGNIERADFVHETMHSLLIRSRRPDSLFNLLGTANIHQWHTLLTQEESLNSIKHHLKMSHMARLADHLDEISPKLTGPLTFEWASWLKEDLLRKAHAFGYHQLPKTKSSLKGVLHNAHPALHAAAIKTQVKNFMDFAWPVILTDIKTTL